MHLLSNSGKMHTEKHTHIHTNKTRTCVNVPQVYETKLRQTDNVRNRGILMRSILLPHMKPLQWPPPNSKTKRRPPTTPVAFETRNLIYG